MSLSLSSQVVQFLVNSRMVYPPSSTPRTKNQSWLESMGGSASCTAKRSCRREKQCLVASHLSLTTKVKQPQIDASQCMCDQTDRYTARIRAWAKEGGGLADIFVVACSAAPCLAYNCVIYSGARASGLDCEQWPIWRRHLFPSFGRPASNPGHIIVLKSPVAYSFSWSGFSMQCIVPCASYGNS